MGRRENILDGLAWAGISEEARVARIAAQLVRQHSGYRGHTKSHVKEMIRDTSPPYGRAKHVFNAIWGDEEKGIKGELARQQEIYDRRQKAHRDWETWKQHQAKLSTRLNNAYAAAFDRPRYEPSRECPHQWNYSMGHDHPNRALMDEWKRQEDERDKGDVCLAVTHQDGYVVALVSSQNQKRRPHIATRYKRGPIVRTYIRGNPQHLVDAAIMLGGPRVRAAIGKGKRVKTDWVGRRSFIYHDGSDHQPVKVEELPWLAGRPETSKVDYGYHHRYETRLVHTVVHGENEWDGEGPSGVDWKAGLEDYAEDYYE